MTPLETALYADSSTDARATRATTRWSDSADRRTREKIDNEWLKDVRTANPYIDGFCPDETCSGGSLPGCPCSDCGDQIPLPNPHAVSQTDSNDFTTQLQSTSANMEMALEQLRASSVRMEIDLNPYIDLVNTPDSADESSSPTYWISISNATLCDEYVLNPEAPEEERLAFRCTETGGTGEAILDVSTGYLIDEETTAIIGTIQDVTLDS